MRGSYCYMSILRARKGAFRAVDTLSPLARSRTIHLFDVPVPVENGKTLDNYLEERADGVYRAVGSMRPVYIDVHDLQLDLRTSAGAQPITFLLDSLRRRGARAIPVTGTEADRDRDYLASVRSIVARDKRGGDATYVFLKVPLSVLLRLIEHKVPAALKQPAREEDVNEVIDAVGFDFISQPQVVWKAKKERRPGELFADYLLELSEFHAQTLATDPEDFQNFETFSMAMVDLNYDGDVFQLSRVFWGEDLLAAAGGLEKAQRLELRIAESEFTGKQMMVILCDRYAFPYSYKPAKAAKTHVANENFNPDFFIKLSGGHDIVVVEIKAEGDDANRNRAKCRDGLKHFETLNERLKESGEPWRYHFYILLPEDYTRFFGHVRSKSYAGWRSGLMQELDAGTQ